MANSNRYANGNAHSPRQTMTVSSPRKKHFGAKGWNNRWNVTDSKANTIFHPHNR